MTIASENLTVRVLSASLVCLTLLFAGCQDTYEPAAYKAAPRVPASGEDTGMENKAQAKLPDITDWTSPEAIRATRTFPAPAGVRGYSGDAYRGIGGYRGISPRGYSGIAGGYRGYEAKKQSYRGYGQQRNYRGN